MVVRRLIFFFKSSPALQVSSSTKQVEGGRSKSWGRKAASFVLITVTGGVALSALDDIAIYQGCSSKAMEKARKNQSLIDAIGQPLEKGPWYNASLAVARHRQSISCSFPISGPQGTGIFHLKAVRSEDSNRFSFFQARDWDILIMDALLHVPTRQQTLRINLSDNFPSPACTLSADSSRTQDSEKPDKK